MTPGATAGARQAPVAGKGVSLKAYVSAVTVFGQRGTTWCGTRVVRPETYHGEEWHFLVDLRRERRLCGGKPPDPLSLAPDISVPNATAILDPPVASSQDGQCRNATLDEESGGPQSCMPPGRVPRYPKRIRHNVVRLLELETLGRHSECQQQQYSSTGQMARGPDRIQDGTVSGGIYLVYAVGKLTGPDRDSLRTSISKLNHHPEIQDKCKMLEKAGQRYLEHSSVHGGGLQAKCDIPNGTELCYYIGDIYNENNNPYGNHSLDMGGSVYVNASGVPRNLPPGRCLHMMNHGCRPNGKLKEFVPEFWNDDLVMFVYVTTRFISKGEQVTMAY